MSYRTFLLICLYLLVINFYESGTIVFADEDNYPVVHTPVGTIRGRRAEDGNYSMFMGIPYAEIDPNNLFGNSKPYPKFEDTFDAFDDSAICPQEEEFNYTIVGSLDCLHINVYVPDSADDDNRLPVFVWIFGGGFNIGFPGRFLYGPSFLVRHDIILVTLNYRLGPYGFMCLDIPEVPGNQGLKDQALALKWTRDNIEAFGGDSSRITIGGNSAGAMSADFNLYFNQEENLYHKVIAQSGSALIARMVGSSNPNAPLELANLLNHNPSDLNDALAFLATVDPHQLIAVTRESGIAFIPCTEKEFENVQSFITDFPVNLNVSKVKDVEVLIGFNNDEMYHPFADLPTETLNVTGFVTTFLNINFDFEDEDELYAEMHEIVSRFYFGHQDPSEELKRVVIDSASDFYFNHSILRAVKKYLDNGVKNMYLYIFSYSGGRNFSKTRLNITNGGASHADELGYLFDISYMTKPLDAADQLIVDRMTELWANFIKFGNPTPETTELIPILWQPVSTDKWHYLELDTEVRVSTRPMHARMAFLDLFYKMNEIYQIGYNRQVEEDTEDEPSSGRNIVLDLSLIVVLVLRYLIY